MTHSLRVGLDLRSGREAWLGGGYYLQNLALALRALPQDDRPELVALLPVDDPGIALEPFEGLIPVAPFHGGDNSGTLKAKVVNRARHAFRRNSDPPFGLDRAAKRASVNLLFPTLKAPHGAPALLPWIYDLQHLDHPELFSAGERSYRTRGFRAAARSRSVLVVSSQAMADAFVARFPEAAAKVRVLRFTTVPGRDWVTGDPSAVRDRYRLPEGFVLLPGQLWVHKDHLTAIEAVRRLPDGDGDRVLALTGSLEDYRHPDHLDRVRTFVAEQGLAERVRMLGVVPRSDYVQLLRAAALVVQPSRYEGWSSVVEDARALGKRMVLSDIAVHVEQAPPGAIYFRTGDADELASRLVEALDQPAAVDERAALAGQVERIASYARTFEKIAREAVEAH